MVNSVRAWKPCDNKLILSLYVLPAQRERERQQTHPSKNFLFTFLKVLYNNTRSRIHKYLNCYFISKQDGQRSTVKFHRFSLCFENGESPHTLLILSDNYVVLGQKVGNRIFLHTGNSRERETVPLLHSIYIFSSSLY